MIKKNILCIFAIRFLLFLVLANICLFTSFQLNTFIFYSYSRPCSSSRYFSVLVLQTDVLPYFISTIQAVFFFLPRALESSVFSRRLLPTLKKKNIWTYSSLCFLKINPDSLTHGRVQGNFLVIQTNRMLHWISAESQKDNNLFRFNLLLCFFLTLFLSSFCLLFLTLSKLCFLFSSPTSQVRSHDAPLASFFSSVTKASLVPNFNVFSKTRRTLY